MHRYPASNVPVLKWIVMTLLMEFDTVERVLVFLSPGNHHHYHLDQFWKSGDKKTPWCIIILITG